MRPALQRLVTRPSSRQLLRLLVGDERAAGCLAPAALEHGRRPRKGTCLRQYSNLAVAAEENDKGTQQADEDIQNGINNTELRQPSRKTTGTHKNPGRWNPMEFVSATHTGSHVAQEIPSSTDTAISIPKSLSGKLMEKHRNEWKESMFDHDRLEFESNLAVAPNEDRPRLLDTDLGRDASLWFMLLGYRKRIYGMEGVRTFWNAIVGRYVHLPKEEYIADNLWHDFLALGFKDPNILESIYQYAKRMKYRHDLTWSILYPEIVGHFLETHQGALALKWHYRLSKLQPPSLSVFADICRSVTSKDIAEADSSCLKQIYNSLPHRKTYTSIVPPLCRTEKYKLALEWHTFLYKRGDTPDVASAAQPLVAYYSIYNPYIARKVTSDLVAANASYASTLSQNIEEVAKISRELMNNIHGQTLDIPAKTYNDELGARWFATTWVSLDVAIKAIHALGVQEIGPLSLQAIALRDPSSGAIVARIDQLAVLGISIGPSLFSRAVEQFARDDKSDLLAALLDSDEHPNEFQNFALQEALLASYAQNADWTLYRMTLEVRLLASKEPEIVRRNIELRMLASTSGASAVHRDLENTLMDNIPFTSQTISALLKNTLGPRRTGHRPVTVPTLNGRTEKRALLEATQMMRSIMKSGTQVKPTQWHEIIRRLGMLGDMSALRHLCTWLANCYGPQNHASTAEVWLERYRIPLDVCSSHKFHPLHKLFPARLQKAIVEWGFIASQPPNVRLDSSNVSIPPSSVKDTPSSLSSGLYILKELNSLGVYIDGPCVRKAIFNRLITYYGPGYSNRRHNERRRHSIGNLEDVAKELDQALGGDYFTSVDLREEVNRLAATRWERRERSIARKVERRPELRGRDPRAKVPAGKREDRGVNT